MCRRRISMPHTDTSKEIADMIILTSQMGAAEGRRGRGVTASNYDTDYTLSSPEMQFAILYEIARSQGISIAAAADKCNLLTLDLEAGSQARDAILKEALDKATPDKPSFILVNYNIAKAGKPDEPHWVVVAVSQDSTNRVTVTHMNSAVRPGLIRNARINGFLRDAVVIYSKTRGVTSVAEADQSRMIQHAHCCGLSCARACASFLTQNIAEAMGYNADLESSYAAQGRRMYSLLQYSQLDSTLPVSRMEGNALVESNIIADDENKKIKNSNDIELEITKQLITQENLRVLRDMCNSHYEFDTVKVNQGVKDLFLKYNRHEGFDMAGAQYELVFESLSIVVKESGGNPSDYLGKYKELLDKYNNDSFIVGNVLRIAANMSRGNKGKIDSSLQRAMEQVEKSDKRAREAAVDAAEKSQAVQPVTKEARREDPIVFHTRVPMDESEPRPKKTRREDMDENVPKAKRNASDKAQQDLQQAQADAKLRWELKNLCLIVTNNDQKLSSSGRVQMLFLEYKHEYGGFDMLAAIEEIGVSQYLTSLRHGEDGLEVSDDEYKRVYNRFLGKIAENQYEASKHLREAKEELEGILRGEEMLRHPPEEVAHTQTTWDIVMKKAGELWQTYINPRSSGSDKGR